MTHCVQRMQRESLISGWSIDLNGSHDVYDEPPGSLQLFPCSAFAVPLMRYTAIPLQ